MRILIVTHYYPEHGGGIEIVAGEIASRLASRGVEIRWAASRTRTSVGEIPGITCVPMSAWDGTNHSLGIPYPLWGPRSLARLAREVSQCDIVHIHDSLYFGNLLATFVAKLRRKPLLLTQHIGLIPYRRMVPRVLMRAATIVLTRWALARSAQTIFISRNVMEYFGRAKFTRPPLFVPNGVDLRLFHPVDPVRRSTAREALGLAGDRPIVLFVGRFVEKKGLPLLQALAERHAEWTWVFVGRGPLDPAEWCLPHVHSAGVVPRERLASYYQAADLLVLPSFGEGFPLVVQEAMACGTPVVIPPETARAMPGVGAVSFVADLSVDAVSRVLAQTLADPDCRSKLASSSARFAAEFFDWDACVDRYLEILQTLH